MNGPGDPPPPADPNVYFGQPIIPLGVTLIVLTTLFVGMRFWSRVVILRLLALEDGFMFLAWVWFHTPQRLPSALPSNLDP
jgi:hypothetical protein